MISSFTGEYRFLSNFYPSPIRDGKWTWPTAEHYYQSKKTDMLSDRIAILNCTTPGQAKRTGRLVTLIPDWEKRKKAIMLEVVYAKFTDNPELGKLLVATKDQCIIEGNNWSDTYWGVNEDGVGTNYLGQILMTVRFLLRED